MILLSSKKGDDYMSDMINPIVIDEDKNICPFCGGEMVIIQHESSLIRLNKDGIPDDNECIKFETRGVCKDCYKEIEVDKDGMYYRAHCEYLNAKKELRLEEVHANPFYKS